MKRIISFILAAVMAAGCAVIISADEPSSWAREEVEAAVSVGLVPEELQKNYTSPVTRGQVAGMFICLLERSAGKTADELMAEKNVRANPDAFTDTSDRNVLAANALGIINGTGQGKFSPDGTLKRAQIAAIINRVARVMGVDTEGFSHGFTDITGNYTWVDPELGWPVDNGIIKGTGQGKFSPGGDLTTEQAILITYRAFTVLKDVCDPLEGKGSLEYPAVNAGELTVRTGSSEGHVSFDVYAGTPGKDYTDEGYYTFRDYSQGISYLDWSPLRWADSDDLGIFDFITVPLYDFSLNSDMDGWSVVCEMAEELPEDVTSAYAGKFGIKAGESGKAWKIKLNRLAEWDDGTPINADSYIYSFRQLLDPEQENRHAADICTGMLQIYGATEYFNQGKTSYVPFPSVTSEFKPSRKNVFIDCWSFWGAETYVDPDGNPCPQYVNATDRTVYSVDGMGRDGFSGYELYEYFAPGAVYEAYSTTYCFTAVTHESDYSWDNVGILKTGDYEIVLITVSPVANPDYSIAYNLSSSYLVKQDLYESLKDPENPAANPYCTSVQTTASYGPYRLTYYADYDSYVLERNEHWYGYRDGKHTGQYQTDRIVVEYASDYEAILDKFLKGGYDMISLGSDDAGRYASSDRIRYVPQSYTTRLVFNTDEVKLEKRGYSNAAVLGNLNFRKAFSLALDRNDFVKKYTAAGTAGLGLLNYLYVCDPYTGASYRNSEGAKAALCRLYGITWGEGGQYGTLDEANASITGYDMEAAREALRLAYEETTADGTYDGGTVTLKFLVYTSDAFYTEAVKYINNAVNEAAKGTGFEGKISVEAEVNPDYYDYMYSGNAEIIFGTWGGSTYNPYSVLYGCYCDAGINKDPDQNEYGFDTNKVFVALRINGYQFTETLQTWARWIDSQDVTITSKDGAFTLKPFEDYDADSKCSLFAAMEYALLSNYAAVPVYYRNGCVLLSRKIDYPVDEYIDLVTFGGTRFITYNYTDEQWEKAAAGAKY